MRFKSKRHFEALVKFDDEKKPIVDLEVAEKKIEVDIFDDIQKLK